MRLVWRPTLRLASAARWVVASLAAGLIVIACSGPSGGSGPSAASSALPSAFAAAGTPAAGGPPIAVVGTENFYADLLAEIGGARVSAQSFLNDPNADPHAFESSPRDAQIVADAKLVIVNGLGYDAFMVRLLAAAPDPARIVIDVQQLLGLPDDANVHVWYDPATMPKVAAAAEAALARLEPANAPYFAAREQAYLDSLEPISEVIASLHARYAGTPVAFTEDVAGYLTDRIGLVVKTPVGFMKAVEEGIDPSAADVAAQRDLLTGRAVRVLLFNSQVISPSTQAIRDLAAANGIPIVGVAETIPSGYATFVSWQLAQLDALGQALGGGGS